MNDFNRNWAFQEQYFDQIKSILRSNASVLIDIEVADEESDLHRATDFKLSIKSGDVAVRIRRSGYRKYFGDITIRAYNKGARTELHKLREGNSRWYLYAWEDKPGILQNWILLDIDKWRDSGMLNEDRQIKLNRDGETGFVAYSINELQLARIIIARSNN